MSVRLALGLLACTAVVAFAAGFHEGRVYELDYLLNGAPSLRQLLRRLAGRSQR